MNSELNKPKILIKKKKIFMEDINKIIGLNKCFTKGSYVSYGVLKSEFTKTIDLFLAILLI